MVIHECDGVAGPELEHCVIEDRPQIVARPELARSVEVVVKRDVEEGDLAFHHGGDSLVVADGSIAGSHSRALGMRRCMA